MCGVPMKDINTNEELGKLVGVGPIKTVIRSGRLRWYGHVIRKNSWKTKKAMIRECGNGFGRTRDQQRRHP